MTCQWTPMTDEMADALLQSGGWGEFGTLTADENLLLREEIRDGLAQRLNMTTAQITSLLKLQAAGGIDTETMLHQTSKDLLLIARMPDGTVYTWLVSCFAPGMVTRPRASILWGAVGITAVALVGLFTAAMLTSPKRKR